MWTNFIAFMAANLRIFSFLLMLAFPAISVSQAIGDWTDHLSYSNGTAIAIGNDQIYCATHQSLFYYDLTDFSIRKLSKANGLSDISDISGNLATRISYHQALDLLMMVYTNGNIDLIQKGRTYNLPDIRNAQIVGEKRVNHINMHGDFAYLATSFGIVVVDLVRREIKDTYRVGPGGIPVNMNGTVVSNDTIYAASEVGLYKAPLHEAVNLLDFNNWELEDGASGLPLGEINFVVVHQGSVVALGGNKLYRYSNGHWSLFYEAPGWTIRYMTATQADLITTEVVPGSGNFPDDARVGRINTAGVATYPLPQGFLSDPREAWEATDGALWIADIVHGLALSAPGGTAYFKPNGPNSSNAFALATLEKQLFVAAGGVDGAFGYRFLRDGFFVLNDGNFWSSFDQYVVPELGNYLDLIAVAVDPLSGAVYFGSYYGGVVKLLNGQFSYFNKDNSSLQAPSGDPSRTTVSGLAVDRDGNLWVSNNLTAQPFTVIMPDGTSRSFPFPGGVSQASHIAIDDFGQKWVVAVRNSSVGLVVYDSGNDPMVTSDDQSRTITTGRGNGNLHTNEVTTVARDRNGEIWIGSTEGITVIYNPGQAFSGGAEASRILIEQDGQFQYLLEEQIINCITVDGANRKWIGTNNGAFLMSPDGTRQIENFNTRNSPLLSNVVLDIAIEGSTGEVYFATDKGIIGYRGTATEGKDEVSDCKIYPNPIRPEYRGPITIDNVVGNASVKITDITGTLVYETAAQGGRVIWDGNNYSGQRAKTGVYLVFISNETGAQTQTCKFLLVN